MFYFSQKTFSVYKALVAAFALLAFSIVFSQFNVAFAQNYKIGNIEIDNPWSRATPDSAKVAGGFFTINNNGKTDDRLVAVTSELSDRTEIHSMAVEDNVMKMRHQPDGIKLPAGSKVVFKPGSFHVMFMDITKPLKKGDEVKAKLVFEKAGSVDVVFKVESMGVETSTHKTPENPEQKH